MGLGPPGRALEWALAGVGLGTLPKVSVFRLQVTVLVMCHTRELAFQISKEYERFSKYMPSVKVSPSGWTYCVVFCSVAAPAVARPVFTKLGRGGCL